MMSTAAELFQRLQDAIAVTKVAQAASQVALSQHGDDLMHVAAVWDAENDANRAEQTARVAYARAVEVQQIPAIAATTNNN